MEFEYGGMGSVLDLPYFNPEVGCFSTDVYDFGFEDIGFSAEENKGTHDWCWARIANTPLPTSQ